ncbi:hypothetical protein PYCCODRAFT_1471362 [Trametes coccinea BRFM310]|uniref:Uncharacterized protein n=1 Tax=Trametes coccinea (strain BRFM310) TaxID=1353009 RepID=A0A1Y2IA63_TRAC3|nr:hypothetical protein PYCCODRAFT_1471362 [Trametes coccinea BRFM310]
MPAVQVTSFEGRAVGVSPTPSTTGAAIAGAIVFGVSFIIILAAIFYYGYRHRHPSLDTPPPSPSRLDIWTGRLDAFLRSPRRNLAAYLRGDGSVSDHHRVSPWPAVRAPATALRRPNPAFIDPPPPYDPVCLPGYEQHELRHIHPLPPDQSS